MRFTVYQRGDRTSWKIARFEIRLDAEDFVTLLRTKYPGPRFTIKEEEAE